MERELKLLYANAVKEEQGNVDAVSSASPESAESVIVAGKLVSQVVVDGQQMVEAVAVSEDERVYINFQVNKFPLHWSSEFQNHQMPQKAFEIAAVEALETMPHLTSDIKNVDKPKKHVVCNRYVKSHTICMLSCNFSGFHAEACICNCVFF